jgi:carbon monoxide dehydrogenase subunit G
VAIRIENRFTVPAGVERAWQVINDVPRIVPCMPGAELTETSADGAYRGNVKVKIGPVQLQFNGEARLYDIDPAAHTMKMRSRASDVKGRGTVASEMAFAMAPHDGHTEVHVTTDLTLTGSVAQYGRGAGLIKEVANQFTQEFAANLEKLVREDAPARPPAAAKPVSGLAMLFAALRAMLFKGK